MNVGIGKLDIKSVKPNATTLMNSNYKNANKCINIKRTSLRNVNTNNIHTTLSPSNDDNIHSRVAVHVMTSVIL